jgi:NAD(P)H-hydrate epimerase
MVLMHKAMVMVEISGVAIGPGLPPDEQLEQYISKILAEEIPVILDAGALSKRTYEKRTDPVILTPHPGEFSRLTGLPTAKIQENRIKLAAEYAISNGVIVVLKGHFT